VPFLDHRAGLVSGDVHSVEVGVAIVSLDFINLEFNLSPGLGSGVGVAISEGCGEDTTSKVVCGIEQSLGFVTWGQSNISLLKAWSKYVVPLFLSEGVSAKRKKKDQYLKKNYRVSMSRHIY